MLSETPVVLNPLGVPVVITTPFRSLKYSLRKAIKSGRQKKYQGSKKKEPITSE
jgi:hypothetical protein